MTEQQMPLERLIAGWMADEATGAPVAHLEQILRTTGRTSPQPRIVALIAEPTLRGRASRAAVGLPNRGLVLAAIAVLLIAALTAIAVGAYLLLQPKPPESADWSGFRGGADRTGVGLVGPTGKPAVAWQFHAPGGVLEVALVGGRAYFASDDGTVQAVSRDRGILQWNVHVADPPLTGPYAADGRLYVSDSAGTVHALAQADGAAIWSSAIAYRTPSRTISVDGTLYFGTEDGFVVALDAATGAERWRLQPPGSTHVDAPAYANGLLFAGTDGAGFVAIDPVARRVAWTADTAGEDTGSATVIDGIAYIGAAAEDNETGSLHAFDASTGQPRWTAADPGLGIPAVADGIAYSAGVNGLIEALDTTTGARRWAVRLDGAPHSAVIASGVVYVTVDGSRRIEAIEAATGRELWVLELDANANCCLAVANGMIVVGTLAGSVYAIGGDGAAIVSRPFPSLATGPLPTPPANASVGPTPTPLPSMAVTRWTADLGAKGIAPVCQIAVDPTTGRIWAPEALGDKIAIVAPDGRLLEEWGKSGTASGQFDFTRGNGDGYGTLAFAKDGSFYVLDVGNHRVQQFDATRAFVRAWGTFGDRPGEFDDPVGIAVAPDGTIWILDDIRRVVEHYSPDGKPIAGSFDPFAASPTTGGANSLAVDGQGNLYVSAFRPNQVSVFDPAGRLLRVVGASDFTDQAGDMAIDARGRLFVTQGPDRGLRPGVLVFGPDGSTIGGFGFPGSGAGELAFPGGIALDGAGGLLVEDSLPEVPRLMKLALLPPFAP